MTTGIILTYHGLGVPTGGSVREAKYWVSAQRFEGHLQTLRVECDALLTVEHFWHLHASTAEKLIGVPTFDDGRSCDYSIAFPALVARGGRGTFFVNTATIGAAGHVDWSELSEMARHGMSIQSHGHDHLYLSALDRSAIRNQAIRSKKTIEDRIGRPVDFFALPYGDSNVKVRAILQECGYKAICTSSSSLSAPGSPILGRAVVYSSTNQDQIQRLIHGDRATYLKRRLRELFLYAPNKLLMHVRQREIPA